MVWEDAAESIILGARWKESKFYSQTLKQLKTTIWQHYKQIIDINSNL